MKTWEQYERDNDPEGKTAEFKIDLKWSLWAADEGIWEEYAPDALRHLKMMFNNTVIIKTTPRKEIRWGKVWVTGTSECEDAPGDLKASVHFESHWDSLEDLADTLGLDVDDEDALENLRGLIPFTMSGEPGLEVDADVDATSVAELLAKVDAIEDALLKMDAEEWAAIEAIYKE